MIDSLYQKMEESQEWNFTIWPIMGQYVWPNYYIGQNYREEADTLKWWMAQRLNWLDQNFPNAGQDCSFYYAGISEQSGGEEVRTNTLIEDHLVFYTRGIKGKTRYMLRDLSGREVLSGLKDVTEGERIDLGSTSNMSSGTYMLSIITSKGHHIKKMIKP
jgi:hypothetical protein